MTEALDSDGISEAEIRGYSIEVVDQVLVEGEPVALQVDDLVKCVYVAFWFAQMMAAAAEGQPALLLGLGAPPFPDGSA